MDKVTLAIEFAAKAHDGMRRKTESSPYILHPLEVSTIVGSMTTNPDVICAALLHDVVEDAGVMLEEIAEIFGERVAELVASETEDKRAHLDASQTWIIRKEESLEVLRNANDRDVLIVWLGDKLSNMRSYYRMWRDAGNELWQAFNQKDPAKQAWYYRSIAEITSPLREYPAWQEYKGLVDIIFENVEGNAEDGIQNG